MTNGIEVKALSILVPGVSLWSLFSLLCLSALTQELMELKNYAAGLGSKVSRWNPLFLTRGLRKGSFAGEYRGLCILSVTFSLFSLPTLPQCQSQLRICIAFEVGVWVPKMPKVDSLWPKDQGKGAPFVQGLWENHNLISVFIFAAFLSKAASVVWKCMIDRTGG